ncbi:hypothetical protein I4300191C4_07320 [Solibaculum mannosilyticum]
MLRKGFPEHKDHHSDCKIQGGKAEPTPHKGTGNLENTLNSDKHNNNTGTNGTSILMLNLHREEKENIKQNFNIYSPTVSE